MNVMRIGYLIPKLQYISLFLISIFKSHFIKPIERIFYGFVDIIKPLGMLGKHKSVSRVLPTSCVGLLRKETHGNYHTMLAALAYISSY